MSKQAATTLIYPGKSQKVPLSTKAAQSDPFGNGTTVIMVCSDVPTFLAVVGLNPAVATTSGFYLPANVPTLLGVRSGESISGILLDGTGNLYVTEGT